MSLSAVWPLLLVAGTRAAAWTDNTLTADSTTVRAVHFTEIRAAVDSKRTGCGLSVYPWSQPIVSSAPIRLAHLLELRTAVSSFYSVPPVFTDPSPVANVTPIRVVHIQELRTLVSGAPCPVTCPATTLAWGGCSSPVAKSPANTALHLSNAAPGYTGAADYTCSPAGTWIRGVNSCSQILCPATTGNWGAACAAGLSSTGAGGSISVSNATPGYTGSATYGCDLSGNWYFSSGSCTAQCPATTGRWSNCSAALPQTNANTPLFATNSNAGYSGSATFDCQANGTWALGSNICAQIVDCQGAWSACDPYANCTKTYHVPQAAQNGGMACPFADGATAACSITGYNSNGPFLSCPSAQPPFDPSGNDHCTRLGCFHCTCLTGIIASPTCTYNSFMSGGNNYVTCVYSCSLLPICGP